MGLHRNISFPRLAFPIHTFTHNVIDTIHPLIAVNCVFHMGAFIRIRFQLRILLASPSSNDIQSLVLLLLLLSVLVL